MSVPQAVFGRDAVNGRWRRFGIRADGLPTAERRTRYPCRARRFGHTSKALTLHQLPVATIRLTLSVSTRHGSAAIAGIESMQVSSYKVRMRGRHRSSSCS